MNKNIKIPKGTILICKTCGLPLYKMLKDVMSNDAIELDSMFDINKNRKIDKNDLAYCPKCKELILGNITHKFKNKNIFK